MSFSSGRCKTSNIVAGAAVHGDFRTLCIEQMRGNLTAMGHAQKRPTRKQLDRKIQMRSGFIHAAPG